MARWLSRVNWVEDVLMTAVIWAMAAVGVALYYPKAQADHDRRQTEAAAHARPSTPRPAPAAGDRPALPR